jgi:hypothetical protein
MVTVELKYKFGSLEDCFSQIRGTNWKGLAFEISGHPFSEQEIQEAVGKTMDFTYSNGVFTWQNPT